MIIWIPKSSFWLLEIFDDGHKNDSDIDYYDNNNDNWIDRSSDKWIWQ